MAFTYPAAPSVGLSNFGRFAGGVGGTGGQPALALDFLNNAYRFGSLTALTDILTCVRNDSQAALAPNAEGGWVSFGPNILRRTDMGLTVETTSQNFLKFNSNYSNAAWTRTNLTAVNNQPLPTGGIPSALQIVIIPAGTTTFVVPADYSSTNNSWNCQGPGGSGATGTANVDSGGGGGGGAWSSKSNISLTPGSTITVQVGAGGSQVATFMKDNAGTTQVSADFGRNGAAAVKGAQGTAGACTGTTRISGGPGGNGVAIAAALRGGGGGGGAGGPTGAGGTAAGGGAVGGGGGAGADNGGNGGAGSAGVGGVGGTNNLGTGAGSGGTTTVAAGAGTGGGGGGGGSTLVGINGAAGSNEILTFLDAANNVQVSAGQGPGGGGGGGGLAGAGGAGILGGGGGGGGLSAVVGGTGGGGGDGYIILTYAAPGASLFTATAANATVTQAVTHAAGDWTGDVLITPVVLTGRIWLTIDGFATQTDVTSQIAAGRWNQCFTPTQNLANPTWGLKIENSGDQIGVAYAQLEPLVFPTTPIPTGNAVATRNHDFVFVTTPGALITGDALTILQTCRPNGTGVGWQACDIGDSANTTGYRFNAAIKVNLDQQVGVTWINVPTGLNTGTDPQVQQYVYGAWNNMGFSAKASTLTGVVALKGDTSSATLASWPTPASFNQFVLGAQRPTGGSPLNGQIGRLNAYLSAWTAPMLSSATGLPYP